MPTVSEIRVSIDVGCHSHSVAIGLPTGEVLEEFDLQHRPEGFDLFFARVERCQRRYGGEVSVAMEGYNGWARPLDTLVRSHGYRLFNINNLKLARFKEIFPAAAKNDRIDAAKLSDRNLDKLVDGLCALEIDLSDIRNLARLDRCFERFELGGRRTAQDQLALLRGNQSSDRLPRNCSRRRDCND